MSVSASVRQLAEELARLPGIGPKSAERLTHHLLQASEADALRLARAIEQVKRTVRNCKDCFNHCEEERCGICLDAQRDTNLVCVVEQPKDVAALERTGAYRGLYHVLLGRIAPLEGVTPDKLTVAALVDRVRGGTVTEVILATNPNLEGESTALHVANVLADFPVKVTRLARGLASGLSLEFANKSMLQDALAGRRTL